MLFGPPRIQSPAVGGRKAFRAHVVGVVVIEHVSAPGRLFETAQQRSPGCRVGAVYNGFLHICSHSVDEKRTATQPHHMNLLRHTPNTLHNHIPGFTLQRRPHRESCTQASRRCDDTVARGAAKETASVGDRPRAPLSSDRWAKEGGCLTSVPCRCSMASRGRCLGADQSTHHTRLSRTWERFARKPPVDRRRIHVLGLCSTTAGVGEQQVVHY